MKVVRESWCSQNRIVLTAECRKATGKDSDLFATNLPDVHIKVLDCVPVLLQVHGVTVALKRIGIMIIEG
jgi:hypothetical protein